MSMSFAVALREGSYVLLSMEKVLEKFQRGEGTPSPELMEAPVLTNTSDLVLNSIRHGFQLEVLGAVFTFLLKEDHKSGRAACLLTVVSQEGLRVIGKASVPQGKPGRATLWATGLIHGEIIVMKQYRQRFPEGQRV